MNHVAARERFKELHASGTFTMPNPHDVGSCRLLTELGFEALATTSGGLAATLGRPDMTVGRDELVAHVAALAASTDLPINVDAERCFPDAPGGVAATVAQLADAGAAGCSIEDWDPGGQRIEDLDVAVERVGIAAGAAHAAGVTLTARCEHHIRGVDDLGATIARLCAYRDAGADCVYAPGLLDVGHIARVVAETAAPVNVLLLPGGPTRGQLAEVGVRRLSTGSLLALVAYGSAYRWAQRLLDDGVCDPDAAYLPRDVARRAFARQGEPT
jgi:2-methylisocitrate lyase-like PEP mutase family enzyme